MDILEYKRMYYIEEKMWWYQGIRDLLYRYIKNLDFNKPLILDAGCGTGKTILFLREKGYKVWGIDASKEAIKFCKKRGLTRVKYQNITMMTKMKKKFDIILCIDVFNALKEQSRFKTVNQFRKVLKKGGIILLQCASLEILRSPHDNVVNNNKRFTKKEVEGYFSNNEWRILKSSYRVFLLFIPVMLIKLIKRLVFSHKSDLVSDQYIPPQIINDLLTHLQIFENRLFLRVNLPIGSSIFLLIQKQ